MVFSEKLAERYRALKEEVGDCIPLMRVGTFMQVTTTTPAHLHMWPA